MPIFCITVIFLLQRNFWLLILIEKINSNKYIKILIKNIRINDIYRQNKELNLESNYMSECVEKCGAYGILRSSSLLEILAEESEKETKETVETVGELKQVLKLLKK